MSPRWGCWEPVWLKLKIRNWDTKRERERDRKIQEEEREMPEEAGRHRNYWQGKKMNPDGKEISQSRRTERREEQRPLQGELVCASEQNGLGGEKTSQQASLPRKACKKASGRSQLQGISVMYIWQKSQV